MQFDEVIVADFEFHQSPGELPDPICMVARELVSGRVHRLWSEELRARREAPFRTDGGDFSASWLACTRPTADRTAT